MSRSFADPFDESEAGLERHWYHVLGSLVCVESEHPPLLELADAAFAPRVRAGGSIRAPRVRLRFMRDSPGRRWRRPPAPRLASGAGMIGCSFDAENFAWVAPALGSAHVAISQQMLRFPYHARYELIEFAVLTLLTRMHGFVPLHAACIASRGRAILLIGDSGAGKSTACLQAVRHGMRLVSEDSVFVDPTTLAAAGLDSFLHLRPRGLNHASVGNSRIASALRAAPRIRRRSGVRKIELDLRTLKVRRASQPVRIAAIVILTPRPAGPGEMLVQRDVRALRAALTATQPYALRQRGWREFCAASARLPTFEMRRADPARALESLRLLLVSPRRASRAARLKTRGAVRRSA